MNKKENITKQEMALRKADLLLALRETKTKKHAAASAEKKARSKELRAMKLSKKAEMAQFSAIGCRAKAKKAHDAAEIAQKLADKKITEIKAAVKQLGDAVKQHKINKKIAAKKQMAMYKTARKPGSVFT